MFALALSCRGVKVPVIIPASAYQKKKGRIMEWIRSGWIGTYGNP
jgi:hypothetical protein